MKLIFLLSWLYPIARVKLKRWRLAVNDHVYAYIYGARQILSLPRAVFSWYVLRASGEWNQLDTKSRFPPDLNLRWCPHKSGPREQTRNTPDASLN